MGFFSGLSVNTPLQQSEDFKSITNVDWQIIQPNEKYDWINQRDDIFDSLITLGDKKDTNPNKHTVFNDVYSRGLATSRDSWCYNSSTKALESNLRMSIDFYNQTVDEYQEAKVKNPDLSVIDFLEKNNKFDSTKFSWETTQKESCGRVNNC